MGSEGAEKPTTGGQTFSAKYIYELLSPHETKIMRMQSILVWESPMHSFAFLLMFHFMFWLFAISSYRFFYVLGFSLLLLFVSHSWLTKIWPEIKVPVPADAMNEEWTHVHPVMLNINELSDLVADFLNKAQSFHQRFWRLRREKPGRFCLYVSGLCIIGMALGTLVCGRNLVYVPTLCLLLWPSIKYHRLIPRFYLKFRPLFTQLDNSMTIRRSHHRTRRQPAPGTPSADPDDSDTDLDDFIPGEFIRPEPVRLTAGHESGGSALSSRSVSPFELEHRPSTGLIEPPDLTPSGTLDADESNLSLLPPEIPFVDDVDRSGLWEPPMTVQTVQRVHAKPEKLSDSESDDNIEEALALGLDVPDLRQVPSDDATTPNYLASVAGQTLAQMGMAGAIGLNRLAEYMKNNEAKRSTVEIEEIVDEEPKDMMSSTASGDFEFIEHDDIPNLDQE